MTRALPLPERLRPRLDVVRHLAVYTSFHRAPVNKIAHGIFVPVIFVSMMCLLAYLRIPSAHPLSSLFHLATVLSFLLWTVLATVDLLGSLVLAAWLLGACVLAGAIVAHVPWWIVVPAAASVHALSWYATVLVGHTRFEQKLVVGGAVEDSNLYFRRRYYLARGLGRAVGPADVLVQLSIAPLSVVQDLLVLAGLRRELEGEIERERERVLDRLRQASPPLAP